MLTAALILAIASGVMMVAYALTMRIVLCVASSLMLIAVVALALAAISWIVVILALAALVLGVYVAWHDSRDSWDRLK